MSDGTVGIKQQAGADRLIDNEIVTNGNGDSVYRQKVAVVASDDGPVSTALSGAVTKATVTASSSGNTTVVTPTAGAKIRLYKFTYSADGANADGVVVGLRWTTSGTIFDRQYLDPKQPYADSITGRYIEGAVDEALVVNLSAAASVGVYVNVAYEEI